MELEGVFTQFILHALQFAGLTFIVLGLQRPECYTSCMRSNLFYYPVFPSYLWFNLAGLYYILVILCDRHRHIQIGLMRWGS